MTWAQHNLLPVSSLQHAIVTGQMKSHRYYRKVEFCFHTHCRLKKTPYHYWAESVFNNCEVDVIYKGCQDKEQPYDDYSIHYKVAFCLSTPFPGPFTSTPDSHQSLLCCSPRNEVVCLCQILNAMQCLQVYQARFPSLF